MGYLLQAVDRLFPDPDPQLVFEIGHAAVIGARHESGDVVARAERTLPGQEGDEPPEGLGEAIAELLGELAPLPSQEVALLLPDDSTRLAVLEFDSLPRRSQELRQAVEHRFRPSLPFAPRDARISFRAQAGASPPSVLALAASGPYVRRCEQALEGAGLLPVFVGSSCSAALNLVEGTVPALALKTGGRSVTMALVEGGRVRLVRRIALPGGTADGEAAVREIAADLFPTLAYIEENLGTAVAELRIGGPGNVIEAALRLLPGETELPVELLADGAEACPCCEAGLRGYVHG